VTAAAWPAPAAAQEFPARPITMVAPYAAGGGNDILARAVGGGMAKVLQQPVVIENRSGASGTLGMSAAARSRPDGYTIVMGGIGSMVLRPAFEGDRSAFDPQKELAPVALVAKGSPVLMISSSLGITSLKELIALAATQRITYGTPGTGSAMHLTGELMKQVTGAPVVHIPYRGQAPAMNDLLSGTISFVFTDVSVALPYADYDKVRTIAITGKERAPQLPNVPTTAELGYPDLLMENWYALYAPRDTPAPIIARLSDAVIAAIALPDVKQIIEKSTGLIPLGGGSEQLRKQTIADTTKWQPIAERARE
jgi:tripartite-type tricarboxylate transporter receptor subunit TctC